MATSIMGDCGYGVMISGQKKKLHHRLPFSLKSTFYCEQKRLGISTMFFEADKFISILSALSKWDLNLLR